VELNRSTVHRGLDVRMKVGGMEAIDLIATLMLAAILNLLQVPTVLILGLPALTLLVLYFGKRNKPDGFLIHLARFYLTPGHYSAGEPSKHGEKVGFKVFEK
jgi:4-hydroxybenzoate polyprenyltransferase